MTSMLNECHQTLSLVAKSRLHDFDNFGDVCLKVRVPSLLKVLHAASCPTCSDNVKNGNEEDVDCGGSCPACAALWTTIMKTNGDSTFQYNASYWSSNNTLSPSSNRATIGNAKYPEFNNLRFDTIRACAFSQTRCKEFELPTSYENAVQLFNGVYTAQPVNVLSTKTLGDLFQAKGYKDCPAQLPGFNIKCRDGNKARWGLCNNIPAQACQAAATADADATIGFGLAGQDCCPLGAGYTNYFVSNSPNAGHQRATPGWIMVKQREPREDKCRFIGSDIPVVTHNGAAPLGSPVVGWGKYLVDQAYDAKNNLISDFPMGVKTVTHYKKGIFTHTPSSVVFNLDVHYKWVYGCVGITHFVGSCGVTSGDSSFYVYGDKDFKGAVDTEIFSVCKSRPIKMC